MSGRDPLGYYAALKLSPDASAIEINLAYRFAKDSYKEDRKQVDIARVCEAYETLGDAAKRRKYDSGRARQGRRVARNPTVGYFQILLGLLVVGIVVLGVLVGPELKAHLTAFDPGDELIWSTSRKPAGTVLAYEAAHSFRGGVTGPAYQIRPPGDEPPKWYPAGDLKRHCKVR